jgi:hypothetical protein
MGRVDDYLDVPPVLASIMIMMMRKRILRLIIYIARSLPVT